VNTKKSSTLHRKQLIAKAIEIAKVDFFKAFHMVHNSTMNTSVGIVGIKVDDKKKDKRK